MVFPWITFLKAVRKRDLGLEELLSFWESQGKLAHNEGALAAATTGTLASFPVTNTKDGYIIQAQINVNGANGAVGNYKAELQAEQSTGVFTVVDTFLIRRNATNLTINEQYNFKNLGHKIDGDGSLVFRIQVITAGAGLSSEGNISVLDLDNGESPIPPA